jgi:hydroxyacylglutathione hydrolase
MALEIEQFNCRDDNFGVLIHDPQTGQTASIDAPEEAPIRAALKRRGWTLTHIINTHWHPDHVEANEALKADGNVEIIGPSDEAAKIPGIDRTVSDGDTFEFSGHEVHVISTPGHTTGQVSFHIPDAGVAFTGDTLFAMGCGRIFEGTPDMMWNSLKKLMKLPPETVIYCGHEYTLANARFAVTVDPDNMALGARFKEVEALRAENKPTLPTTMEKELATNPFLRASDPSIRAHLGMEGASDAEVFAEIRHRKDNF